MGTAKLFRNGRSQAVRPFVLDTFSRAIPTASPDHAQVF